MSKLPDLMHSACAGLRLPPDTPVLYEEVGGIVEPEKMIQAHVLRARHHGAHVKTGETVRITGSYGTKSRRLQLLHAFDGLWLRHELEVHQCAES